MSAVINALDSRTTLMTAEEVAEVLSLSKPSVYQKAAANKLPCISISGSIRFDPKQIADLLRTKVSPVDRRRKYAN